MKASATQDTVIETIIRIGKKAEDAERYGEALRAQELLGKHLGLFTASVDVNVKTPPPLVIQWAKSE